MMRMEFGKPVVIHVATKNATTGAIRMVEEKMPFKDFLKACLAGYEKFKTGPEMGRLYARIRGLVDKMTDKQRQVDFETEDFKMIKACVALAGWLSPDINADLVPFYDVVDAAFDPAKNGDGKKTKRK